MDGQRFDRLVRLLGTSRSRRSTLGALVAALAAVAGDAAAKNKRRHKSTHRHKAKDRAKAKDRNRKQRRAGEPAPVEEPGLVTVEATCNTPESGANLNGCDFSGDDFTGDDLHGSSMRGTNFTDAILINADLHGSNMRGARFTRANLCNADLYSSTLRNATFTNANLTRADLHSSNCAGANFSGAKFCQTIKCNGTTDNSGCPAGQVCCLVSDCEDRACQTRQCLNSECVYANQPNGQPGNLCAAPRQCCNGVCCANGQKCCGGTCIANDACCTNNQQGCPNNEKCCGGSCIANTRCCTNGVADACPTNQQCCGGTCFPNTDCCENNTPGCPQNETCVIDRVTGKPFCCPNANVCGGHCEFPACDACFPCDEGRGICVSKCLNTQVCCGPGDTCRQAGGQPCNSRDECCPGSGWECQGFCCVPEDGLCDDPDFPCCPGLSCVDSFCE